MTTDRDPADAWDAALNDARTRLNAADPFPGIPTRTALDRAEDTGWDGPEWEYLREQGSAREADDAAERAVGGGGPW